MHRKAPALLVMILAVLAVSCIVVGPALADTAVDLTTTDNEDIFTPMTLNDVGVPGTTPVPPMMELRGSESIASVPVADFSALPTSGDAPLDVQFTDGSTNTPNAWGWNFGDSPVNVYVTDTFASAVNVIYPNGTVGTVGSGVGFSRPNGIAVDHDGNVFVGDVGNHKVYKIFTDGTFTTLGGDFYFNEPDSLAVDDSGNVFIADSIDHNVYEIFTNGTVATLRSGYGTASPRGVAVDTNGVVYVASPADAHSEVDVLYPDGTVGTLGGFDFFAPYGVAVDRNGNVIIGDSDSVYKHYPNGTVTPMGPEYEFAAIYSNIAVDSFTGDVFVAQGDANKIMVIHPDGTYERLASGHTFTTAFSVAVQPADSIAQSPSHIYAAPGTYNVTLIAANADGANLLTKTGYITANMAAAAPVANFTANVTTGTYPLTVQFNDTSENAPTSWAWDFTNDGTVDDTTQNPVYTYPARGTYTVNLTATNAGGSNTTVKTNYITVTGTKTWTVGATGCDFTSIENALLNPSLADGDTIYLYNGTYTFIPSSSKTVARAITITGEGPSVVYLAVNNGLTFSNTVTISGIHFKDSTNSNFYLNGANTVVKNCIFENCKRLGIAGTGLLFEDNTVNNMLIYTQSTKGGNAIYRNNSFSNLSATGSNNGLPVSKDNNIIDNNSFSNYGWNGIYFSSYGTNNTISRNTFLSGPAIQLYGTAGSINYVYLNNFITSNSINRNGDPGTWIWNTTIPVEYTYNGATYSGILGNYWGSRYTGNDENGDGVSDTPYTFTVVYLMTDNAPLMDRTQFYFGATHTIASINVTPPSATVNVGTTKQFNATALDTDGLNIPGLVYLWTSDNETVGTVNQTGLFTALAPGLANVTATNGTFSNSSAVTTILLPPVANFTANVTTGSYYLPVQFTDNSTYAATWAWNFGDGNSSTAQNPFHLFATAGNFTVNLTVTNAAGQDSTEQFIVVTEPSSPVPGPLGGNRHIFIGVANDEGVKYNLDGLVYANGSFNTYYVKADSGGLNELHVTNSTDLRNGQVNDTTTTSPDSAGSFFISNTGSAGVTDDLILLLAVNGTIPDDFSVTLRSSGYNFTPNTTVDCLPTDYVHANGTLEQVFDAADFMYGPQNWKPGPGTLNTTPYLQLYFGQDQADGQTYQLMFVDLRVGALNATMIPGLVDNGFAKVEYEFHNMTSRAAFNVYGWRQAAAQGQGISWTNKVNGTGSSGYTVLYQPLAPVANFTANVTSGRVPLMVQFNDTSTGNPNAWNWTFGDGELLCPFGDSQNPAHNYRMPGTYTVNLTVTNAGGSDTESKPAFITVLPQALAGKIAVYRNGSWYLDSDDSGNWNAGDAVYGFGSVGWEKVVGDWDGDGDREIGVYQAGTWYVDENGDGGFTAGDGYYRFGSAGWQPLAGDWNGDRSDEIAVYLDGIWYLDVNGDGLFDAGDRYAVFGAPGWTPVVGDWDGDAMAEIGVYRDGVWYLDMSGDGLFGDGDAVYFFGGAGWTPIVGNWDGDGATEIGVYNAGAWYLETNGDGAFTGADLFCGFGAPGWTGVIGDWDSDGSHEIGVYQDSIWYVDLNGDGRFGFGDIRCRFGAAGWDPVVW